ncbi:MAG: ClpXP protease specificity-enhancing factor [Gammaproteobacteria bacterium]|nr:ClpXP protease specificity-enhancing factor [Gammaproteobacteria bacterium]
MTMTSSRPYLIRAIYDWIVDNQLTPYLLVNAEYPGVEIPQEYVTAGRVILNVSPESCRGLHLDNDRIVLTTRFSGRTVQLALSPGAVLAIYAKENGRGMEFNEEDGDLPPSGTGGSQGTTGRKPALRLVK